MKYENEALKVIHENAKAKFKIGLISEARMSEFDEMCLLNPKTKKVSAAYNKDNPPMIKQINTATA